jgi:hypothetical protein
LPFKYPFCEFVSDSNSVGIARVQGGHFARNSAKKGIAMDGNNPSSAGKVPEKEFAFTMSELKAPNKPLPSEETLSGNIHIQEKDLGGSK